jgi:ferrous iron transport protein A
VKTPDSSVPSASAGDSPPRTLADLRKGDEGVVLGLSPVTKLGDHQANLLVARLRDLGFVTGASFEVIARMWPGGDPIAVRIGGSSFALRRAEAAAVHIGHR